MILIVSGPEDDHAQAVRRELAGLGAAATVLDLASFPQEMSVAIRYEGAGHVYRAAIGGEEVPLDRFRVVWWRRPQPFVLHPEIARSPHATFAYNESVESFAGLWESLRTFWVNHPTRDRVAGHKVYQLRVAQEVGLDIPRTVVTNDPEEARAFAGDNGAVAYKAFMPTEHDWRETRLLRPAELAEMESVRYAPVIFQEYVPPAVDLRVTVVGDDILAAAIHTPDSSYQVDYRMDMGNARVERFRLPRALEAKLKALMDRLGLVYGAIDMRLDPNGRYVFFEVNPAGQWLFIEERTGQPITETFARLLASKAERERVSPPAAAGAPVRRA